MSDALVLRTPPHTEVGNPTREIRIGAAIAATFFVVLLGWAALTPLDAGVNAPSAIAVNGDPHMTQNKGGGVITARQVREGQHVPGSRAGAAARRPRGSPGADGVRVPARRRGDRRGPHPVAERIWRPARGGRLRS